MIDQWAGLLRGIDKTLLRLAIWFAIALLTMVPLERMFALRRHPTWRRPGFAQDVLYFVASGVLPAFVLVFVYAAVTACVDAVLPSAWFAWVRSCPGWTRLALTIVVADLGYYWAHRWAHETPRLWRLHAIHHSPTAMDWLVATRTHPLEIVYVRGLSFVPVYALGLIDVTAAGQSAALMLLVVFNTFWGFFIHANVGLNLGWIERIVTTPRFHHWHHADDSAAVHNKNYAALLPALDMVFGTFHLPQREFPKTYGSPTRLPHGFMRQLFGTFGASSARRIQIASDTAPVLPTVCERHLR